VCYHVKFGSSASKGVCISRREAAKLGSASAGARPFAAGAWLTPNNTSFFHVCYPARFGHSRSNNRALLSRLPEKFDPSRPAFQDYSRSSEPTRIDPPSMTSY